MKLPFPISNFPLSICRGQRKAVARPRGAVEIGNRQLAIDNARRGVALVITLIMLSVTLIMALAFMALSRRERSSVSTTTDTAAARLAADAALAAAQAQIAANILGTAGLGNYNYSLVVSTNYINPAGYFPGVNYPTNVNYDYRNDGTALNSADLINNIANLYLLPRVPVFVKNPVTGNTDFRFYLDLNRNGLFDANGSVPNVSYVNGVLTTNGNVTETGDPEWIGVLEHPDQPHGPNNHFVARYAFLAQPVGNGLDLNYIHNQTITANVAPFAGANVADGYFRNEGVGSWELNLAAFLADLNTNIWGQTVGSGSSAPSGASTNYLYLEPAFGNSGNTFNDAQSLLSWRYGYNYGLLAVPSAVMNVAISGAGIDGYTVGNLMTNTFLPQPLGNNLNWAGSDNTNRFYELPSELFDPAKSSAFFTNRLAQSGIALDTYDRYTYYRLLDELGTDSTADDGKMNLNYRNVTNGVVVTGLETNAYPWTPLEFFTNAADRMLKYYTAKWLAADKSANHFVFTNTFGVGVSNAFGVSAIPVYVNGQFVYTPAVNRILQLAANIYDATTTNFYPSVFRPTFLVTNQNGFKNLYVNGYTYVSTVQDANDVNYFLRSADASAVIAANSGTVLPTVNVYGVPWIIGAKKGLPGFNQFSMLNLVQVTRKLQVNRPITQANPTPGISQFTTNQMYLFTMSNLLSCSLWNSYASNYVSQGNLTIAAYDELTMILTNDAGMAPIGYVTNPIASVLITTNLWPGADWNGSPSSGALNSYGSFIVPFNVPFGFMSNGIYRYAGYSGQYAASVPGFDYNNTDFQTNVYTPALPHFGLLTTNRLQVFILDGPGPGNYHVLDYVHFAGPDFASDINAELADPSDPPNVDLYLWSTNPVDASNPNGTPYGVVNQINYSSGATGARDVNLNSWQAPPNYPSYLPKNQNAEQAFFSGVFNANRLKYGQFSYGGKTYSNLQSSVQAPYTPTRMIYTNITWQANDPLVHYLASDLNYHDAKYNDNPPSDDPASVLGTLLGANGPDNVANVAKRYSPWGRNYDFGSSISGGQYLAQMKDPLVESSDNWDFPNFKLPTAGWLGRVHRGTPWQTVYLKASDVLTNATDAIATGYNGTTAWEKWTGDNNLFDATNTAPLADAGLFDLFTTRFNDNAAHGTLSVNQTHLAAWSALFSGLTVPTSLTNSYNIISPAGPAGDSAAVGMLVTNINATRAAFTNGDGLIGAFEHVGDILRAPLLTEQSPFLAAGLDPHTQISDELYEWLPQQTLGLLRVSTTPRYVIYCYGQALRPAVNGTVTAPGNYFGLVTNYQIMAESAARAVVRVNQNVVTNNGVAVGTNYSTVIESYNVLAPQ
jgi:hypothetical protein